VLLLNPLGIPLTHVCGSNSPMLVRLPNCFNCTRFFFWLDLAPVCGTARLAMFDWQAELQSLATPAVITTSGHHPAVAVVPAMTQPTLSAPHSTPAQAALPKPSFAQALRGTQVPSEPLPVPAIHGETLSIRISNTTYSRGLDFCKINLRGRLVLNKGDKLYATKDITAKLQKIWKVKGPWHMLSLGQGYYEFFFASQEDMRTVWAAGTVSLKRGLLRLFEWTKDFNLHTQ